MEPKEVSKYRGWITPVEPPSTPAGVEDLELHYVLGVTHHLQLFTDMGNFSIENQTNASHTAL